MAGPDISKRAEEILGALRAHANPDDVDGMARFGITAARNLGVSMPTIKSLAREARATLGRDREAWHELAAALWDLGWRDTRMVATFLDHPSLVTGEQMEAWAADLDSWDVCDGVCGHLFDRSPLAWDKAPAWTGRGEEFVKRAGFVLMASLAVHDKKSDDARFLEFLPLIEREATDSRNFVRKAVNWALRQIGKRSETLRGPAIECAGRILASAEATTPATDGSRAARWVARDALRELTR